MFFFFRDVVWRELAFVPPSAIPYAQSAGVVQHLVPAPPPPKLTTTRRHRSRVGIVFLSGVDEHHQLIAKTKGAGGFTVKADRALAALKGKQARDLTGTFSYRVMAKRNDIKGERMPVWEMPEGIVIPDPPKASASIVRTGKEDKP